MSGNNSREDGEVSDGFDRQETPKRKRAGASNLGCGLYEKERRFGGVMEDWRQCMRDDEASNWAYEERLRRTEERFRAPSESEVSEQDNQSFHDEPQAMSTRRHQDPFASGNDRSARVPRMSHAVTNPRSWMHNTSASTSTKMFKVDAFPKGVKPTEQLQEWAYWLANFQMAAEKAGVVDQRARAIDLSLHIGEAMRRIIITKDMMPSETKVSQHFPFYDNLVSQLDEHFKGLTDESVDVTTFNTLKQAEKETALEFEMRLKQVAKRVNETNQAMIRTRYIDGLRDKEIRDRAFIDGIPLHQVVRMATRKEAIAAKQPEFSPWGGEPVAVAMVERNEQSRGSFDSQSFGGRQNEVSQIENDNRNQPGFSGWSESRPTFRARQARSFNDSRQRYLPKHGSETQLGSKCGNCGISRHKTGQCPAENKICFGCGESGHFRHKCPRRVSALEDNGEEKVLK